MATSSVHALLISALFAFPFAFCERGVERDSQQNAALVTRHESRQDKALVTPGMTIQVKQSDFKGDWSYDFASNFKRFYKNDAYSSWRIVIFKDSEPEKTSEHMEDEMDALSKMRNWKELEANDVVKTKKVEVIVELEDEVKTVVLQAMAIEWIDGDFFDIAKIQNTQAVEKQVLLIVARGPDDKKVPTGIRLRDIPIPEPEALKSKLKKIQSMYESLARIKKVEAAITDLQVIVEANGHMVVMDPYCVDESRLVANLEPSSNMLGNMLGANLNPVSNNMLGANLNVPGRGNGGGQATKHDKCEGFDMGRQKRNIDEALATLETLKTKVVELQKADLS